MEPRWSYSDLLMAFFRQFFRPGEQDILLVAAAETPGMQAYQQRAFCIGYSPSEEGRLQGVVCC